jgi:hypothetical protein
MSLSVCLARGLKVHQRIGWDPISSNDSRRMRPARGEMVGRVFGDGDGSNDDDSETVNM